MTLLATSLQVAREVIGSIPVGDSVFFFSHACDKLNIPSSS